MHSRRRFARVAAVNPAKSSDHRVPGLDVFRSAAILLVLACHFSNCGLFPGDAADRARNCLAVFGVELFFVLSGFLIGTILIRDFATGDVTFAKLQHFWSRRWFRTLPNYYVFLPISLLLERAWRNEAPLLWRFPFFLQNFAWTMPHAFIVSWSLAVEEWFYLLFPLVLAAGYLVFRERRRAVLTAVAVFVLVPFVLRLTTTDHANWDREVHTVVIYRLDAIGFGVALAYLRVYHERLWGALRLKWTLAGGLILALAAAVFMCAGVFARRVPQSGIRSALLFEVVNIACALLLPWFSTVRNLPSSALACFTRISIISYSLYLCHMPVMLFMDKALFHLGLVHLGLVRLVAWTAGTWVAAECGWRFIEKPCLQLRDSRKSPTTPSGPTSEL
jgi:peptidoglycan/LPS O-acetylase OafA/YrhL